MKFLVESSVHWERDKLIENYPCLRKYGYDDSELIKHKRYSSFDIKPAYITIDSLEQLLEFMNEVDAPVIVNDTFIQDNVTAKYSIEIYDGYRE